jgi:hypothetical protein
VAVRRGLDAHDIGDGLDVLLAFCDESTASSTDNQAKSSFVTVSYGCGLGLLNKDKFVARRRYVGLSLRSARLMSRFAGFG